MGFINKNFLNKKVENKMNTVLISYDLIQPVNVKDYGVVVSYIKSCSASATWAEPFESVFIIFTEKSVAKIRDELLCLRPNVKILVLGLTAGKGWATSNVSKEVTMWMSENL